MKTVELTQAPCTQKDATYSISIAIFRDTNDDAPCHNAEQGRAHPQAMVLPNADRVHPAGGNPTGLGATREKSMINGLQ